MRLDRLLLDIFDWIRRSLYYRRGKIKRQPYKILKTGSKRKGLMRLVQRDTPRAVRTYLFTPYPRYPGEIPRHDWHICLDHLYPINIAPQRRLHYSHRISIIRASRWISHGSYEVEELFSRDYALERRIGYRDQWAIAIVDSIASIVGENGLDLDWAAEIEMERKRFLGGEYKP